MSEEFLFNNTDDGNTKIDVKIESKNSSMISRLLGETRALGLIKISPDSTSDKNRRYLTFWA